MKKLLSFLMAVSMVASLAVFAPAASAEIPVYTEYLYDGMETEAELRNFADWDIEKEFSNDGVFGSCGAAKLHATSVNAGVDYRMYLTEGKMYRFSAYVKPLDFELKSANLILLTEAEEGGSGWESVTMNLGETTDDGYTRIWVEYRISDRVYPGSQKEPLDKKAGAQTRVVLRMNKEDVNYLIDEIKVEPTDYVAFENFDNASSIPHKVTQPTAEADGTSETYTANIIAHNQSNYSTNTSGFAHITGSSTRGAYFPNLTLMPVTTYRVSADVTANSSYDVTVYPYYRLASSQNGTMVPSGHKTCGSGITVSKGTKQHVEFLFRTEGAGTTAYVDGIPFDKFGIVSNGSYVIWDCDNLKIEKVDDIIYAGDMENVTVNSDNTKLLSDLVCSAGQTPVVQRDGKDTTLEIANDGTNGDRGSYLKMHFVGTESENAADKSSNNRRAVWYVNLKKATTYRISFWAKVDTEDDTVSYNMAAMHNMGKVDTNGLVNGEEGFTSSNASYGYIKTIHDKVKVNNKWQYVDVEYTVQNRQQVAPLYLGVTNFGPKQDVTLAIDDLKVEEIGTKFNNPAISYSDGVLTATETAGAQMGEVTNKNYTFFVSDDGVNYAKAGESANGTFAVRASDSGKYMKAVVEAVKADGTKVSAETDETFIPGFSLKFTSDLNGESVNAVARYYPETDEVKNFDGIIALYTEDNELISVDNFTSAANIATMYIANEEDVAYAKIFAWDSLTGTVPMANAVVLTK